MMDKIIENTNKKISEAMKNVKPVARVEAKNTRNSIIKDWFGRFDFIDVVGSTETSAHFTTKNLAGKLIVETWTNSEKYGNRKSAERWRAKHGGEMESSDYVLDLQFNQGIIGLPEFANTTPGYSGWGWKDGVNLYFHQQTPLAEEIENSKEWDIYMDEIEEKIMEYINK
jgi:hypothetical protein